MTNLRPRSSLFSKIIFSFLFISFNAKAEINPQLVNLNMQFKAHNIILKSDLTIPYYQTVELEKKVADKNFLIELDLRPGKNSNEVAIEMRFYKAYGLKAFAKREVVARAGEESKIKIKGMSVKLTPILQTREELSLN